MNQRLSKTFNLFGYLALYVQWMWALALFMPTLSETELIKPVPVLVTDGTAPVQAIHLPELPPAIALLLSLLILAIVVVLVAYALIKGPRSAVVGADLKTSKLADEIVPLLTHHKKISHKQRVILSQRLVLGIKLSTSLLGFLVLFATYSIHPAMSYGLLFAVGFMLLPWPLIWFSLAYILQPSAKTK